MIADPDRGKRGVLGLTNRPDTYEAPPGGKKDHQSSETTPLQAARRANADQLPAQHAEVEAREVNQEALQDIAMSAQMRAPHPAGLVGMRKRSLDPLAAPAHQALAAGPPDAPTIRIDGRLGLRRLRPIAAAPIRLGDIRPDADGLQIHHDLITVIALVRDQRGERLGVVHLGVRLLELVRRGDCRVPMVVVSPRSAPCTVTATIAPVSRSTHVRLWATERRIKAATCPVVKSLETFEFRAIPSLNKSLVLELARSAYLDRRENVLALGNSGTGKTHLALALGLVLRPRVFLDT